MTERHEAGDGDLRAVVRRIAAKVSNWELKLSEKASSAAVKDAFDEIQRQLDGFATEILASRSQRTFQDKTFNDLKDRLDKHALRLRRLDGLEENHEA